MDNRTNNQAIYFCFTPANYGMTVCDAKAILISDTPLDMYTHAGEIEIIVTDVAHQATIELNLALFGINVIWSTEAINLPF